MNVMSPRTALDVARTELLDPAGKDVLDAIRKEKALSDDLRGKLKAEIDAFTKTFASDFLINSYLRRDLTRRIFSTQVLISISSSRNAGRKYSILCSRTTQVESGPCAAIPPP